MHAITRILSYILGTALVVFLWYHESGLLVGLLDLNLWGVKTACALLPGEYATMTESILRMGVHADKALLLAEGSWLVAGIFRLIKLH